MAGKSLKNVSPVVHQGQPSGSYCARVCKKNDLPEESMKYFNDKKEFRLPVMANEELAAHTYDV